MYKSSNQHGSDSSDTVWLHSIALSMSLNVHLWALQTGHRAPELPKTSTSYTIRQLSATHSISFLRQAELFLGQLISSP